MKFCKIVLIILLAIKSFSELHKVFTKPNMDHPVEDIIGSVILVAICWALYYGAGILDV